MTDIVERLRKWSNVVPVPPAADTMGEAAGEIDRLRLELSVQKACTVAGRDEIARLRLTDEEREAIELAVHCWTQFLDVEPACEAAGATLRNLLERLHT